MQIVVKERLHSIVRGDAEFTMPRPFNRDEIIRYTSLSQCRIQPDGLIIWNHAVFVAVDGLFPKRVQFPIQEMGFYGVKLSMGLGDPSDMAKLMGPVESGRVNLSALATHVFPLDKALEAYDLFENNKSECVKVLLKP